MSTCVVKIDPRSVYAEIAVLDPPERNVVLSMLLQMWCHEGHVEDDPALNARRCGMRPSSFKKSFMRVVEAGSLDVIDGRVYPGWRIQRAMRRCGLTPDQRAAVFASEAACAYCASTTGPFDIDHIYPASRGGTNHRRNLTLACISCNSLKSDRTAKELLPK